MLAGNLLGGQVRDLGGIMQRNHGDTLAIRHDHGAGAHRHTAAGYDVADVAGAVLIAAIGAEAA